MVKQEPIKVADITLEERKVAEQHFEESRVAAQRRYGLATRNEWKKYEDAWRPLREAWMAFQRPFFDIMQEEILKASRQRDVELSEAGSRRPSIIRESSSGTSSN